VDKLLAFVNKFKTLLISLGIIGAAFLAFNAKVTDYARLPGTVDQLEEQVTALENVVQDLRMLLCVERAHRDGTDPMDCVEAWKDEEAAKQ
jgi:hypothetical protein